MDIHTLTSLIPAEITLRAMLKFLVIFSLCNFVASLIFRLIFGKKSAINKAVCASIGILCIYVLSVVVYTFRPGELDRFLVPLPFVTFSTDYLHLISFSGTEFPLVCSQIVSMILLVLLYNLCDSLLPERDESSVFRWLCLRLILLIAAMFVHWFFTGITASFLPELLISHGSVLLLACIAAPMLMGSLKVILSLLLVAVNPVVGFLYSFFFTNRFGRQISKATLTTGIICLLVVILNGLGYRTICISADALPSYLPLLAVLLGSWYYIGEKM